MRTAANTAIGEADEHHSDHAEACEYSEADEHGSERINGNEVYEHGYGNEPRNGDEHRGGDKRDDGNYHGSVRSNYGENANYSQADEHSNERNNGNESHEHGYGSEPGDDNEYGIGKNLRAALRQDLTEMAEWLAGMEGHWKQIRESKEAQAQGELRGAVGVGWVLLRPTHAADRVGHHWRGVLCIPFVR